MFHQFFKTFVKFKKNSVLWKKPKKQKIDTTLKKMKTYLKIGKKHLQKFSKNDRKHFTIKLNKFCESK